jgi:hypothetical protein
VEAHPVTVVVSERFPLPLEQAWTLVFESDVTEVSQPWGPIPGVVDVRDEEPGFPYGGATRVLVNSDGSTVVERFTRIDPPHVSEYTITDLTNAFRMITPGADASFTFTPSDGDTTEVVWRYNWHARSTWTRWLLWLAANAAYKGYMARMLHRMSISTPGPST